MKHFASQEMLGNGEAERCCREVHFETRRCVKWVCVLRPVPHLGGSLQHSPDPLADLGEGNKEGNRKRRKWRRKREKGEVEGNGNWGICSIGFRG